MKQQEAKQVLTTLDELRAMLVDLTARVATLEASTVRPVAAAAPPPPAAVTAPAPPPPEAITEDVLMVISAAVAAFLGKRAHVRQIRLISSSKWAQEGRVSVQASHRLAR